MPHRALRQSATVARRLALVAAGLAAAVLGSLALGVLAPGIPLIGLAGRWHVLDHGAWWLLAALGAALALAIAASGSARRRPYRVLAGLAIVALMAAAVFGVALGSAGGAALTHGVPSAPILIAGAVAPSPAAAPPATSSEVYARDAETGDELLVDIYRPADPTVVAAVLLSVHGGGWILHDRSLHARTLGQLADEGIVVMAIDYALATRDRATWQSAADQTACALAWAAANAERFGGDPELIVLAGDSAGGGLALATAYRAAAGAPTPDCGLSSEGVSESRPLPVPAGVAGVVPVVDVEEFHANPEPIMGRYARTMVERYLGGTPAEHPDRAAAVDAMTHLTAPAPPTLLVTVAHDHLVPSDGTRMLAAAATARGVPVTLVEVPFGDHGLIAEAEGIGASLWRAALVRFIAGLERDSRPAPTAHPAPSGVRATSPVT